jgi:hypothetical protein
MLHWLYWLYWLYSEIGASYGDFLGTNSSMRRWPAWVLPERCAARRFRRFEQKQTEGTKKRCCSEHCAPRRFQRLVADCSVRVSDSGACAG